MRTTESSLAVIAAARQSPGDLVDHLLGGQLAAVPPPHQLRQLIQVFTLRLPCVQHDAAQVYPVWLRPRRPRRTLLATWPRRPRRTLLATWPRRPGRATLATAPQGERVGLADLRIRPTADHVAALHIGAD